MDAFFYEKVTRTIRLCGDVLSNRFVTTGSQLFSQPKNGMNSHSSEKRTSAAKAA
jgi:hypothetical protein